MAVNEQALFAFYRPLPEPFDKVKPKLPTVHSKYSDKTGATLSTPLIKAVHAYMACRDGSGLGAVGRLGTKTITEYKSAMSTDAYHLVVYDTTNGMVCATVYDLNTEIVEQYTMSNSGRDGSAVHLALMPVYLTDDEFADAFEEYMTDRNSGYPDMTAASEHMALMCDNAYRRVKDETCAAHIKLGIDKSGNLTRITKGQIDASKYVPDEVIAGEFRIFAQTGPARICARSSNRDGAALRYVAEQLSKRPEDMKLLILVSDGQPADSGYYGTAAEEDLRGIKQEYRRKGVHLIAAAIGDDKESIERIYGDSFLDISDLTKLPVALTAMVKRFIRA